ncbi:PIN domain-containing protein [Actinoplanes sp. NPDC026619]|uniref:PIN domain-containing protein n=1 Tax=Actinoplanes sp. NPDC026619 TaxID=3155798 RepID=UPI0033DD3521
MHVLWQGRIRSSRVWVAFRQTRYGNACLDQWGAWRDARRQVQLGRFLHSCEVLPVGLETAKTAGVLCGKAGTRDVVDATVVTVALAYGAIVFTSDPDDITHLGAAAEVKPGLVVRRV